MVDAADGERPFFGWLGVVVLAILASACGPRSGGDPSSGSSRQSHLRTRLLPYWSVLDRLERVRPFEGELVARQSQMSLPPASLEERVGPWKVVNIGVPLTPSKTAALRALLLDPRSYAEDETWMGEDLSLDRFLLEGGEGACLLEVTGDVAWAYLSNGDVSYGVVLQFSARGKYGLADVLAGIDFRKKGARDDLTTVNDDNR